MQRVRGDGASLLKAQQTRGWTANAMVDIAGQSTIPLLPVFSARWPVTAPPWRQRLIDCRAVGARVLCTCYATTD